MRKTTKWSFAHVFGTTNLSEIVDLLRFYAGLTPVVCLRQMVAHQSASNWKKRGWEALSSTRAGRGREGKWCIFGRSMLFPLVRNEREMGGGREACISTIKGRAIHREQTNPHRKRESPKKRGGGGTHVARKTRKCNAISRHSKIERSLCNSRENTSSCTVYTCSCRCKAGWRRVPARWRRPSWDDRVCCFRTKKINIKLDSRKNKGMGY